MRRVIFFFCIVDNFLERVLIMCNEKSYTLILGMNTNTQGTFQAPKTKKDKMIKKT